MTIALSFSKMPPNDPIFFPRSNRVKMISPTISASESGKMCFSFWFAAFGAGDTTSLKIYK